MPSVLVPVDRKQVLNAGGVPMSFFTDPVTSVLAYGGGDPYQEPQREGRLSFELLKRMSKNSIISLIITTRVNQVASFSQPAFLTKLTGSSPLGFTVLHKEKHQKNYNRNDVKRARELMEIISKCGSTPRFNPRTGEKRDNFDTFLRKIVRDSLTYDQLCFEKVRARNGRLLEWWAVDASTIRFAGRRKDGTFDPNQMYVQVLNGTPVVGYAHDELCFFVRNPRTDVEARGYGYSELEQLIRTITSHLNAEKFNQNVFTTGTTANGVLVVKGDVDPETLAEFRRQWQQMVTGVAQARKTPVLHSEQGAEFLNMGATNKDMEYSKWMEYLITVACGVFQIDPGELGFNFRGGLDGQAPMFETGQEAKLKHSKDKGLRPLLNSIARMINEELMEELDPAWYFTFVGIDAKSEEEVIRNRIQEMNYKTLDEIREELDLDPLGEEKGGNLICNPQYVQWLLQRQQQNAFVTSSEEEDGYYDEFSFEKEEQVPVNKEQE